AHARQNAAGAAREGPRRHEARTRLPRDQAALAGAEDGAHVARTDPAVLGAEVPGREDVAEEDRVVIGHLGGHPLAQVIREGDADPLGLTAAPDVAEAAPEDRAAGGGALGGQTAPAPLALAARER